MDSFTSWFSTEVLMLTLSFILGVQTIKEPHHPCTLNKIVGESAQLHLSSAFNHTIREIEWSWSSGDRRDLLLVSWSPDNKPSWYEFGDKYKHRFNLTESAFLNIRNLTVEMGGRYTAKIKFHSGESEDNIIKLCVYEPVPQPQILIRSSSNTVDWCNVTLECGNPGVTEQLTVTWWDNSLSEHLEKNSTLEPTPNSRNLTLSLPLGQVNSRLICVVSNPADQKNATLDLGSICLWRGSSWSKWLWTGILATVLVVSLGAGVWIWKRRKIKTETAGGSTLLPVPPRAVVIPQALPAEDSADPLTSEIDSHSSPYAEIVCLQNHKTCMERGSGPSESPQQTPPVDTVYVMVKPRVQGGCLDDEDSGTP